MTTDKLCRYINSYTFNVQIYHTSSFKKIKINHTIISKCHLSIHTKYDTTRLHVQTYFKKNARSSNISNNLILSTQYRNYTTQFKK